MALFKISKGVSSRIPALNRENTQDGWCWFTTDDGLFHIDYEDNGVLQRKTLNANDAKTLTGASMETGTTISESATKIPTSKMVNTALGELRSDIQDNYNAIADLEEAKMNKVDPQGSGKVSINGTATGDKAVAFGGTAEGANSFSLGASTAKGTRSFAGGSANAEGSNTFAFGISAQTTQDNAFAFGNNAKATGIGAVSFGNEASGQSSFAEGSNTIAQGTNSHSAGFGTKASHKSQFVIGEFNAMDNSDNPPTSRGKYAFIIGKGTGDSDRKNALTVTWDGSISHEGFYAGGNEVEATGLNSHAEGNHTKAQGDYSHAEGNYTEATGENSHAEGFETYAEGHYSHTEGGRTLTEGTYTHAEGFDAYADGEASHAEGIHTIAIGTGTHAEGSSTYAEGEGAHAEGISSYAYGMGTHAEGSGKTYGTYSHAEGYGTYINITISSPTANGTQFTVSSWDDKLVKGAVVLHQDNAAVITAIDKANLKFTTNRALSSNAMTNIPVRIGLGISIDTGSHSEGTKTTASGHSSHSEGFETIASGVSSHAEGYRAIASGYSAHAGGYDTVANGNYSFAHGRGVIANGTYQTVFGKYNDYNDTTSIFAVGGGDDYDSARNVFTVDTIGNTFVNSTLNVGLPTDLMAGYSLGVNGYTYFNDFVSVSDNYTPTEDNHLVNRKFVTDNLPNITHIGITATEGQNVFDFSTVGLTDLSTYYLVFYDGLLLMEGMHYNITDKYKVSLLDWTAPAGHMIHVLGFKPIQAASMSYDALELINGSY